MSVFPSAKSGNFRRIDPQEMFAFLASGPEYPPFRIQQTLGQVPAGRDDGFDALVEVAWADQRESFVVEMKTSSQPLMLDRAIVQAERMAQQFGQKPLIFVPYLSEQSLRDLEKRRVSGIDMVGNAVILCDSFRVWRSGAPSPYRESRPLQNPYRGDSSIFVRCFLLQPRFESLTSLRDFALTLYDPDSRAKAEPLQLGTASKVVQALTDEMIVMKDKEYIRLVDPRRLLTNLQRRYRRPDSPTLVGKSPFGREEIWNRLADWRLDQHGRYVASGSASAGYYGVLFGEDRLRLYVDDLRSAADVLQVSEGRAFANIELIEERKGLVYFDAMGEGSVRWASMIQTWLELAQSGGAREREASESLYDRLVSSDLRGQL